MHLWWLPSWRRWRGRLGSIRYTAIWLNWCLSSLWADFTVIRQKCTEYSIEAPTIAAGVSKLALLGFKTFSGQPHLVAWVNCLNAIIHSSETHIPWYHCSVRNRRGRRKITSCCRCDRNQWNFCYHSRSSFSIIALIAAFMNFFNDLVFIVVVDVGVVVLNHVSIALVMSLTIYSSYISWSSLVWMSSPI